MRFSPSFVVHVETATQSRHYETVDRLGSYELVVGGLPIEGLVARSGAQLELVLDRSISRSQSLQRFVQPFDDGLGNVDSDRLFPILRSLFVRPDIASTVDELLQIRRGQKLRQRRRHGLRLVLD